MTSSSKFEDIEMQNETKQWRRFLQVGEGMIYGIT